MSSGSQLSVRSPFTHLMWGAMIALVALVTARFILELAGVPHEVARYISSTVGLLLIAIYVAAVGPLRGGFRKYRQLAFAALVLAAWTEAWIILATLISAALGLTRSHFAEHDIGNRGHLARHLLGHVIETVALFLIVLLLMSLVRFLWRWPVTVAPGALMGVFVIMRFWTEAMGLPPLRTAAWSSTVLVLLSAFYLGGLGERAGHTEGRHLLMPALVLGWTWRAWVYLATLLAAALPALQTHFFDPSPGHVAARLLRALAGSVVEGFVDGIIAWSIAVWVACSIQPLGPDAAVDQPK